MRIFNATDNKWSLKLDSGFNFELKPKTISNSIIPSSDFIKPLLTNYQPKDCVIILESPTDYDALQEFSTSLAYLLPESVPVEIDELLKYVNSL